MQLSEIASTYNDASPLRFAFWVGLCIALVSASVNITSISNDNIPNVLIPVSVLRDGNFELGEFFELMTNYREKVCYWAVTTDRGTFSRYPIWCGIAATPFFITYAFNQTQSLDEKSLLIRGRFAAVAACALFAGLIAATFRRFTSAPWAATLAAFTVLGTTIQHQLGANLSNQTLPLVCIVGTLFLVTSANITAKRALGASLLAGLAVASRLPSIFIAIAPLGVFLSQRERWRQLPLVAAGLCVFPALTLLYQHAAFGSAFVTGYGDEPNAGFNAPILQGLAGLLVSPTCGLFVYSPWLLFAIPSAICLFRDSRRSSESRLANSPDQAPRQLQGAASSPSKSHPTSLGRWLVLGILCQWVLFSKWWAWNGALTFGGPRMLAEIIPALALLIVLLGPMSDRCNVGRIPPRANVLSRNTRAAWWLLALGGIAALHFAIGTACYDAIAPDNPIKNDWDIGSDFIALFVQHKGVMALALAAARNSLILVVAAAAAIFMSGRMLRTGETTE